MKLGITQKMQGTYRYIHEPNNSQEAKVCNYTEQKQIERLRDNMII